MNKMSELDELQEAWAKSCKLIENGEKMCSEANKFSFTCYDLSEVMEQLNLLVDGQHLIAEGIKQWMETVFKLKGNIKSEYKNGECHLETGEVFKLKEGIKENL